MQIIFEDSNYLILNKPAGVLVHSDGREGEPSVTDWLAKNHPELEFIGGTVEVQHGEPVKRWGIAHRIDRETSGILVVAKNQEAFEDLQKKFHDRKVKKTYNAFVYGRVILDEGVIDESIGRSKADFRRWSTGTDARGEMREAVTEYKVLHKTDEVTFVEAMPKTGRTHQIRVHFRSIGHPIVADKLYSNGKKAILGFERLALHSKTISFKDLVGKVVSIEAPYPEDFEKAFKILGIVAKN